MVSRGIIIGGLLTSFLVSCVVIGLKIASEEEGISEIGREGLKNSVSVVIIITIISVFGIFGYLTMNFLKDE